MEKFLLRDYILPLQEFGWIVDYACTVVLAVIMACVAALTFTR
jgi:hypothetical protein